MTTCRPSLIVHIGLEKTGTTSIQDLFHQHESEFAKAGLKKANGLSGRNYVSLGLIGLKNGEQNFVTRWTNTSHSDVEDAGNELIHRLKVSNDEQSSRFASSELISSSLSSESKVKRFCVQIFAQIPNALIVLTLRRQEELLISRYTSAIFGGTTREFDKYLHAAVPPQINAELILGWWEKHVPVGHLRLVPYIESQASSVFLFRFFSSIGVNIDSVVTPKALSRRSNLSLTWETLEALRLIRERHLSISELRWKEICSVARNIISPFPKVHPLAEDYSALRRSFEVSNLVLALRFNGSEEQAFLLSGSQDGRVASRDLREVERILQFLEPFVFRADNDK